MHKVLPTFGKNILLFFTWDIFQHHPDGSTSALPRELQVNHMVTLSSDLRMMRDEEYQTIACLSFEVGEELPLGLLVKSRSRLDRKSVV